jgi:hypothetical protein
MPEPPKMKPYTFKLDDAMRRAMQFIKERDGVNESEQIRRGLKMWLAEKGVSLTRLPPVPSPMPAPPPKRLRGAPRKVK